MENNTKKNALKFGVYVFIILAVLTAGEYAVAVFGGAWWSVLVIIALIKAWFVVQHYMHLPRLFAEEGSHEH
ncbi:MAG: cytochrome C oxidase subunit IV family protein [Anaerolineae bacterium]|nr:cytochrome C oxidase subunit IV family protein [Anaerolineae bacterium]MBL6965750.1 cytochrome C oxidase subunit IV family protein [Anaerolineales bacterium]